MYEMNYPPWLDLQISWSLTTSANRHCLCTLYIADPYTFTVKTTMADDRFVNFCHALLSCNLFAQIAIALEHSTVDIPGALEVIA